MTKLTQKSMKFEWGEKAEAAFQLLKQKLCSAPILALPEGSENFIVYCDASHKGLGAVLMQDRRVIVMHPATQGSREEVYHNKRLKACASSVCLENVETLSVWFNQRSKMEMGDIIMDNVTNCRDSGWGRHALCYADVRRKPLEFQVGDKVMLKVSPWKGVILLANGKAEPSYIRPLRILAKVGPLLSSRTPEKLKPVEIMDCEVKHLKQSRIPIVKGPFLSLLKDHSRSIVLLSSRLKYKGDKVYLGWLYKAHHCASILVQKPTLICASFIVDVALLERRLMNPLIKTDLSLPSCKRDLELSSVPFNFHLPFVLPWGENGEDDE
ncbi:putative reverse transcriptase domain-containing protein [Tanacetum coccineum]